MALSQSEARGLFTKKLLDVYQERIRPKSFLRSFFPSTFSPTKNVSIEVERIGEKIASDVIRGSEGNFNRFAKSTEKIYVPPMWREYFNATEMDIYDRVLGSESSDNKRLFAVLLNQIADRIGLLQDKIERAKELQCAQVLQTGIVTMVNGDNIDFKRKAASMPDIGGPNYFSSGGDVFSVFKTACVWLRQNGKTEGHTFIAVLGDTAMTNLLKNTIFTTRQNLFHLNLDQVMEPQQNTVGGVYHGTLTCGPYRVQLWTYPEYYENSSGVMVPYVTAKNVIVMPPNPRFKFAHCLVPQLVDPGTTTAPQKGEWVYGDFIDTRKAKHDFDVQCAGVPVPVAVDQIYTFNAEA